MRRDGTKQDGEADAKAASAAKASSESLRRSYERQAQPARKEALRESDKIASFSKDLARVAGDIGTQQKALTAAEKSTTAAAKRESDKAKRVREAEQRREAQERKAEDDVANGNASRTSVAATPTARPPKHRSPTPSSGSQLRSPPIASPGPSSCGSSMPPRPPDKKSPLRVDQEMRRVKAAVKASTHRDLVAIDYIPAATPNDVLDTLVAFRPHVVHFSGHANESVLVFEEGTDGYGPSRGQRIRPDLFKELLESTDEAPMLVVLNACKSAGQLDSLLGKVAMAIGMDDSIGDVDAIVFATLLLDAGRGPVGGSSTRNCSR